MIDNDLIQAALVARANITTEIISSVLSGTIAEYDFQGTDWHYPCARIHIEFQTDSPDSNVHCPSQVDFSWYVFSERGSSKQANQLAGIFVRNFRGLSFAQNNIKFVQIRIVDNIPAIRQDVRTWRSQVRCRSTVHNT